MCWSDYYEKIHDWAVSTAVSMISSIGGCGEKDMIIGKGKIICN